MDPFSLLLGVSGLALQLFGASQKQEGASAATAAQKQEVGLQQQQEAVKMKFMETDARRKNLEVLRNQQRAMALATNNATTQGAQFGSGLSGGLGQISGMSNTNQVGINNALTQGREMFGLSSQISQTKLAQLKGQQQMSEGAGFSALGSSAIGAMGPLHQLLGYKTA